MFKRIVKTGMPPSIWKAKIFVSAIAVSSSEVERGFPKRNVIYSDKRSRFLEVDYFVVMKLLKKCQ